MNGIISRAKEGDIAAPAISFAMKEDDLMIHLNAAKEGMKVDVFVDELNQWKEASIVKIIRSS